ncbi:MAG: acyl-CoA thioesterase [Bacteroidetes bacterium]|nr:MAG: acyl-CoA thioesterase [Bacteroidota bacterium]
MFSTEIQIRVRYAETDQMGYVYYGNYATYFEVARVESLRNLGMSYKALEESGIMLPVLEYKCKYLKPAKYDDLLRIKVVIKSIPTVRIYFEYEVYNDANELLSVADTTLVFINAKTMRPCAAPALFLSSLEKYFKHNQ